MKEQMHLRVDGETAGALRALGAVMGLPVGVVVAAMVERYLDREPAMRKAIEAMATAQETMGGQR